jgi:hypothetical protein
MKKYILRIIAELQFLYPSEKITVINGFIGIKTDSGTLKHSTYIGNAFFEIDGIMYTDYNGDHRKLMEIK